MNTPSVILYGETCFDLEPPRVMRRAKTLDGIMGYSQANREDAFAEGAALPDYPHMFVRDCETQCEVPGYAYTHRWQADGLLTGKDKVEDNGIRQPEEGWDEGPMTVLTRRPDLFVEGMSHPQYSSLILTGGIEKRHVIGSLWRVQANYQGILGYKPVKRTYSVNSKEERAYTGYIIPGLVSSTAQRWTTLRSRIQMTERFLKVGYPPTELIGKLLVGGEIPADTPTIITPPINTFTSNYKYMYPYGWRVASVAGPRLREGRLEHDVTVVYDYVQFAEIDDSSS